MSDIFDVAIVGAGPAGTSTAISLSQTDLTIALIDKEVFPRDKICGDALSPDVTNQLNMMNLDCGPLYDSFEEKIQTKALRFVSPKHKVVDLAFTVGIANAYVSTRLDFDNFMFQQALKAENVEAFQGMSVRSIEEGEDFHTLKLNTGDELRARMIVGCDGPQSVIARQLGGYKMDKKHHAAGLRQYYENVSGMSDTNAIELHFYNELVPGYFWIFPLPNNRANVGLGMQSEYVSKHNINLKERLEDMIANHPNLAPRFKEAKPLESIKGMGIPMGSRNIKKSGHRFLLAGDAASIVNPLTGEGIGNAIRSGRIAADHIKAAFSANRFDVEFNRKYDREIKKRMGSELKMNYYLHLAMKRKWLTNLLISNMLKNEAVQTIILSGFEPKKLGKQLLSLSFYRSIFTSS